METITIEIDEHARELLFTSLCYFDADADGYYKDWFLEPTKVNLAFHYLYDKLKP